MFSLDMLLSVFLEYKERDYGTNNDESEVPWSPLNKITSKTFLPALITTCCSV